MKGYINKEKTEEENKQIGTEGKKQGIEGRRGEEKEKRKEKGWNK
jgi:hypothetical protein